MTIRSDALTRRHVLAATGATALTAGLGAGYVQVPSANLFRTAQTGSFTLLGDTTLYAQ